MKVIKISFGILVLLAVVTMVSAGCGGQATPPTPMGNQPPVIASLVAQSQQLYPSANTEITCTAQDADGDHLNFTWTATGGDFSGIGPIVVWKAPPNYGMYTITITVDDGKGGSTQRTLDVTVGANQAPSISSLNADPSGVLYGGSTTITCIASDPDGDVVRYSWTASSGSITGVGNKVTWIAPSKGGSYTITVIVSDSKGGETRGEVPVTVATSSNTVTIPPVAQETGSVRSDGDRDYSVTKAGDDSNDKGYRACWSYDVFSLAGKDIQNATLRFTTRSVVGDPFSSVTGLAGLRFWKVSYGNELPSPTYTGSNLINVPLQSKAPTAIDVTQEVANVAAGGLTKFQVEALFMKVTNGNHVAEFIEWSDVVLEVTFAER
ncbi:MAG: PKD domain-containing protein [Dehalococcoidia bacterium]|nr:PKD domain-containing protein [Dehalococcoidia bacterium]